MITIRLRVGVPPDHLSKETGWSAGRPTGQPLRFLRADLRRLRVETWIPSRCCSGHRTPDGGLGLAVRLAVDVRRGGHRLGARWPPWSRTSPSRVFVVLYDVTAADEENMDRWEGSELGLHKKIRCRIVRESSDTTVDPVLAWLYVVDGWEGGLPSARYLGVMADAAEVAGAPAEYVHDLRTRPSRNIGPGQAD